MTTNHTTFNIEANYERFVAELTALTRKYGVAIQSVGGVILADNEGEFRDVTYVADISSGDLLPQFPQ
ncbi:MAG: hypothetical protein WCJ22_06340 [Actinomycetes bacterium]|jgi:hypothetical protein